MNLKDVIPQYSVTKISRHAYYAFVSNTSYVTVVNVWLCSLASVDVFRSRVCVCVCVCAGGGGLTYESGIFVPPGIWKWWA